MLRSPTPKGGDGNSGLEIEDASGMVEKEVISAWNNGVIAGFVAFSFVAFPFVVFLFICSNGGAAGIVNDGRGGSEDKDGNRDVDSSEVDATALAKERLPEKETLVLFVVHLLCVTLRGKACAVCRFENRRIRWSRRDRKALMVFRIQILSSENN